MQGDLYEIIKNIESDTPGTGSISDCKLVNLSNEVSEDGVANKEPPKPEWTAVLGRASKKIIAVGKDKTQAR